MRGQVAGKPLLLQDGPVLPYPLIADETAILAVARQRRADRAGLFLAKMLRLPWLGAPSRPQQEATPLDTPVRFR